MKRSGAWTMVFLPHALGQGTGGKKEGDNDKSSLLIDMPHKLGKL